ncbi:MAG: hypothetical protein R2706_13550 [Acidimicrobiales bacterium]
MPTTICSDLLKPGGYGRLAPLLKQLGNDVTSSGHGSLRDYVAATSPGAVDAYVATLYAPDTNGAYTRDGTSKLLARSITSSRCGGAWPVTSV